VISTTLFPIGWVLVVILSHWVADFVVQTDRMAQRRNSSVLWLSGHVLVYMATLNVMLMITWGHSNTFWILLNGVLHWITELVIGRAARRLRDRNLAHEHSAAIGLEQMIHYSCLFTTAAIALRAGIDVL
jgi:ascorbate-specific PTS system EIIC-type component UlaA